MTKHDDEQTPVERPVSERRPSEYPPCGACCEQARVDRECPCVCLCVITCPVHGTRRWAYAGLDPDANPARWMLELWRLGLAPLGYVQLDGEVVFEVYHPEVRP